MAFNSLEYLGFFLLILLLSWATIGIPRVRIWLMLIASYYFYTANNHWLIVLILISTQIDYFSAIRIEDTNRSVDRKFFLALSLCGNLGILGFFKYFNFFTSSIVAFTEPLGIHLSWVDLHIVLPVGISFYTFQSMSYTIDVYRGDLRAERSWHRFAFFVAFFPQLVAGPIVRPKTFLPQLDNMSIPDRQRVESALQMIFLGLFKKIVLADFLALYADSAFNDPANANGLAVILGTYAFTMQIYYDFSGYSDIAIGSSRLIGFELPENFRRPYAATSITDFWRRWHISLSSWLRDYLYIPLGGNRASTKAGVNRNLYLTMLLGGLWHGAAWHFIFWGGLQGMFLVLERQMGIGRGRSQPGSLAGRAASIFVTFHLTCLSWIVFRAETNSSLTEFFRAFGRWENLPDVTVGMVAAVTIVAAGWIAQVVGDRSDFAARFAAFSMPVKAIAYAAVTVAITTFGSADSTPFIYFRF